MSVTIRGLFREAQEALRIDSPDAAMAAQAAGAINHCGRALAELEFGLSLELGYRRLAHAITDVIEPCRIVGTIWPDSVGRAEALAGAAADLLAHQVSNMWPAQRWAVAVAVTGEARRFAEVAREFPPYHGIPQLHAVRDAAVDVLQLSMLYPSTASDRSPLDRSAPRVRPDPTTSSAAAAQDAVAALAGAVHSQVARGEFTMSEVLACATALEIGMAKALTVVDSGEATDGTWRSAPAAWRAIQRECAPLDDGSKANPPKASPVIGWATELERALTATFGSQTSSSAAPAPELVTTARAIVNQAPDIAADLMRATHRWTSGAYLLARERALPSYEDRNLNAADATDRVVLVRGDDLSDLGTAVRDASRLSMSLAHELDRGSKSGGEQPHPGLAARHGGRSSRPGDLAALEVMADRARRSAVVVAERAQWSYARGPVNRGPDR